MKTEHLFCMPSQDHSGSDAKEGSKKAHTHNSLSYSSKQDDASWDTCDPPVPMAQPNYIQYNLSPCHNPATDQDQKNWTGTPVWDNSSFTCRSPSFKLWTRSPTSKKLGYDISECMAYMSKAYKSKPAEPLHGFTEQHGPGCLLYYSISAIPYITNPVSHAQLLDGLTLIIMFSYPFLQAGRLHSSSQQQ